MRLIVALLVLVLIVLASMSSTRHNVSLAWSNGGYGSDPDNPDYGTHDFVAQHALDWVPDELDFWVRENLVSYLYGTELPDNANAPLGDGIGDQSLHHVYYYANGQLRDDASALRAQSSFQQVSSYLAASDYENAAKWMGVSSHYLDDLGVFGHVMGSSTDWGAEVHHSDYETWVNSNTASYSAAFTSCLSFDGGLLQTTAYDAALNLAHDTTFDDTGKGHTAKWMDTNYNPSDPTFIGRVCESINKATNLLADMIYTASTASQVTSTTLQATSTVAINEVEQNPPGYDSSGGEFVELFNPSASAVDISGWIIKTADVPPDLLCSYTIPGGTGIDSKSFYTKTWTSQCVDNDNEVVMLVNNFGNVVDQTPALTDTSDNNYDWQRVPDGTGGWYFRPATKNTWNAPPPPSFDFSLSNSGSITVTQGGTSSNTITATLLSGSTQPVTLSCTSGLPSGASCSFSPTSGNPTFSSSLTLSTPGSTPAGSYTITVTGTGGGPSRQTQFTLTVNPASFSVTFHTNPANEGAIGWGSCSGPSYGDGSVISSMGGSVNACYVPSGYTFASWTCSGGLSCSSSTNPTTVTITGPGSIMLNLKSGSLSNPVSTSLTASASPNPVQGGAQFTVSGMLTANGVGIGGAQVVLVFGWDQDGVVVTTQSDGSYSYLATAPVSVGSYDIRVFFLGDYGSSMQYLPCMATAEVTAA